MENWPTLVRNAQMTSVINKIVTDYETVQEWFPVGIRINSLQIFFQNSKIKTFFSNKISISIQNFTFSL